MDNLAAVAQFLAQALDVHIDGPAFAFIREAPNGFHDLFPLEDDIRIDQEVAQEFKFLDRQVAGLAVDGYDMFFLVQGNGAIRIEVRFRTLPARTAQDGADAGNELDDAEGLADVVIGATIEAPDDIVFAGLGRQHDDGQCLVLLSLAQFVKDIIAAFTGQHDIQEEQSRCPLLQSRPEFLAVSKGFHLEVLAAQGITNEFTNIFIIFYTVNQRHKATVLSCKI